MKVVYINLDRSPDRKASFLAQNAHLTGLERFPAVDGAGIDRAALEAAGLIRNPIGYSDGALGLFMSHLTLWRRSIERDETLTIAEDDAVFHRDFEKLGRAQMARAGDFSLILWCWNFDGGLAFEFLPGISSGLLRCDQALLQAAIDRFPETNIAPGLYPLLSAFGTCCYTITPKGARHLLARILPLREGTVLLPESNRRLNNYGIDVMMNAVYREMGALVCFPPLVATPNLRETSTVQG